MKGNSKYNNKLYLIITKSDMNLLFSKMIHLNYSKGNLRSIHYIDISSLHPSPLLKILNNLL